MKRFLIRRFFLLLFTLFAVSTLIFFMVHLLPGDPALSYLGADAHMEDLHRVRHQMNLNQSLFKQYLIYIQDQSMLRFGNSLYYHTSVMELIRGVFPYTFSLAFVSILLVLMISFPLGVWAALKGEGLMDSVVTVGSSIGLAIPCILLGPLLILICALWLDWLPVSGTEGFEALMLPAFTLAVSMSAVLTRIIKNSVATELTKPYVEYARAKGLSEWGVLTQHVLKNSMIPVITTVGLQLGVLLTGTVVVETVFSRQGLGSLLVTAVHQRDYPMIQGIVVCITAAYLLISFLVDVTYFFLDPRILHGTKKIPA